MKKNRLIPILLLKNGVLVKSKRFGRYQTIGNPLTAVKRLSEWASDELIYLDITKEGDYSLNRDDLAYKSRDKILDIIADVSRYTHMPITVGGGINSLKDIEVRLKAGADKVSINTAAVNNPDFITEAANQFGSQCIVVSVDYMYQNNIAQVYHARNKLCLDMTVSEWLQRVQDKGAGEILLNAVERDGVLQGYDLQSLATWCASIQIPMIACGGAGSWQHMLEVFQQTKADAVAAANIFHYTDQSVFLAKQYLHEKGANVRTPDILKVNIPGEQYAIL